MKTKKKIISPSPPKPFKSKPIAPANFPNIDEEIDRTRKHLEKLTEIQNLRYHVRLLEHGENDISPAERLISIAARVCKTTVADIKSPARPQYLADARFAIYALAKRHSRMSLTSIGRDVGGRDHATVQHGCSRIPALMLDKKFAQMFNEIESQYLDVTK